LLPAPPRGLVPEAGQLELPFGATAASGPAAVPLPVPGFATLPDGRRILAEVLHLPPSAPIPREAERVELDADRIPAAGPWTVRAPRPGDRFHPLGGPGSRPLRRFLADSGVPRGERSRVPLVCAGGQILWAAGLRPAQAVRIGGDTRRRIRLTLWPR
jgi:tRNA(Ile)-lysidine synthase